MSDFLPNFRAATYVSGVIQKLRRSPRQVRRMFRGLKIAQGWSIVLVFALCLLLVGGISLFSKQGKQRSKNAGTLLSAEPQAKVVETPTKLEGKQNAKGSGNTGTKSSAKKRPASVESAKIKRDSKAEKVAEKQTAAQIRLRPEVHLSPSRLDAKAAESEQESGDEVRRRASWFFDQRAYPNKHIPADAFQKAIEQRDSMRQQQRAAFKPAAGAQAIISFPGDALWHLMGPQPINTPFGQNSGFPIASGRVTAIAVDPTNASIVYIGGAAGGVWKTTDGGTTWTAKTDAQPSLAIGSIAIDPNSCSPGPCTTIYAGTGEDNFNGDAFYGAGILKSTDGGNTWTQLGASSFEGALTSGTGGAQIGAIAVQPGNPTIVLASVFFFDGSDARGGVWRSTDSGATWHQPTTGAQGSAGTGVFFESTSSAGTTATAWAALGDIFSPSPASNGIWKSTDSGATWTKQTSVLPTVNVGRITLGYAASTSGATATVYAAIADSSTTSSDLLSPGLFKTVNGGTTWTSVTGPAVTGGFCAHQCFYDIAIGVSPANPSVVVLGGGAGPNNFTSLFESTNGGASWTPATAAAGDFSFGSTSTHPHVDTHALVFSANGAILYVGNDGGMWSTNTPTPASSVSPTWTDLNAQLAITQFYPGITAATNDENYGFGGTQDNDTELFQGNGTLAMAWQNEFICGDGGFTAIDQSTPTTIWAGCNVTAGAKIKKAVMNGQYLTFANSQQFPGFDVAETAITASGDNMQFIPPLAIDDNDPNTVYFGTCRVWQTTNAASSLANSFIPLTPTWNPISNDLSNGAVVTTSCPAPGGAGNITNLEVAHSNSSVIVAGTSNGKAWESITGTWTEIDAGALPNRSITAVRTKRSDSTGNIVYVTLSGFGACASCGATPGHVFKSINAAGGAPTWTNISGDLPDIPVNDIVVDHHSNPTLDALYIATDVGVFACPDPEAATPCTNWTVLGDGLPNSPVLSLALRRHSGILRAATHGRSMWQIQVNETLSPLAALSSITPAAVPIPPSAGTTAVTVTGVNFSANTQVVTLAGPMGITTTFVNTTQLNVTIPNSLLQTAGVFPVLLTDPAGVDPGSTFSSQGLGGLRFTVMNPLLDPNSMTPTTAQTFTAVPFHLTSATAAEPFLPNTVLAFYDTSVPPVLQFQLPTAQDPAPTITSNGTVYNLTTAITDFTTPTTYQVIPYNPTPGGGIDDLSLAAAVPGAPVPFTFTVTANPGPVIQVSSPLSLSVNALGANTGTTYNFFQVTNLVGATLNITNATITGANATNFIFIAPGGAPSCNFENTKTVSITGGSFCFFGLQYTAGTPPGNAQSVATLNVFDQITGSPQSFPITGNISPTAGLVFLSPVNFGNVAVGTTSPMMNATLTNASGSSINVTSAFSITGANLGDFHIVPFVSNGDGNSACPSAVPFALPSSPAPGFACDVTLTFTPSLPASAESANLNVTASVPVTTTTPNLTGVGIEITSISPSIVATGGPAFTLTVNGGGFAPTAVVNVSSINGTNVIPRLTTFVSANQLLASIPASDITTAGSLAITVTTPVPGGTTSEPKTLVVAEAPSATNDNILFATNAGTTPFRVSEDTTQATTQLTAITTPPAQAIPADPLPPCASGSKARSVWFQFKAPANGKVIADSRFSTYTTILSAWTLSGALPSSTVTFSAVASGCASGNVTGTTPESLIGFAVTANTTYYVMVTDASASGLGGTLTFSLDFQATAPANDDNATPTVIAPAALPYSNTVNSIQATANTNGHTDPTPPCAAGAAGTGQDNSVWWSFTPTSSGMIVADTLTSPYATILNVTSGTANGTQVACNVSAGAGIAQSQVSFAAASGTTYFFMVSSFLGDGGTTNFHLIFTPGVVGPPAKLAVTTQPTNVAAGASITPAVQVTVQDASGNTVTTATNSITMAIGTNPGGGTLSGTVTVAAVNGIATFSSLSINKPGVGYTLAASATGLTGATSNAFNVTVGAAAKLAFTVQPSNVAAGASITPAVQVTVQDAGGNTVTTATSSITMAIGTNPGGGTLGGTVTVAAVSGIATFSNLSINKTGTGYTLGASATGLTSATSTAFNVTPGAANKLAFSVQPSNVGAGAAITPAVQATIQDANGNTVTSATNAITVAIGTNPAGGALSGTTSVAAVSGVATFSNLSINNAGVGYTLAASAAGLTGATSTAFNVTSGTAAKLAFTVQPSNVASGSSITPAVQVTVQDATGNTVTSATNSITIAIGTNPAGGTLSGTVTVAAVSGVATFSNLSINNAGNGYTLAGSASGLTGATSAAFNVTSGTASKLAITVQPTNVAAGSAITPAVQVTIQDASGNTVTSATNSITMAIGTNPSGGTLSGTVTVAAVSGVATFSTLSINKTGNGYTLAASATGLTGATSNAFNVTAGAASKLAFTVQPTNVIAGAAIAPAVQVTIQDAQGNTVTSAVNPVTVAIGTNPSGGTLSGTVTVAAVSGVATFSNLSINKAGTGYTLGASATGLTGATSTAFNVTAGAAAKLAFTVQPTNVAAGAAITPAVQVTIQDAQGNTVTSATNSITMAIGTNPSGGTLGGTTTVAAVSGVATFSTLNINKSGNGYTLGASATGLTGATSSAFNVTAGAVAKLAITVQPTNVAAGAPITPAVQVTVQDAGGNTVTSATNSITMTIGTNPGGGTLSGTVTVAAVSGVATFSNLSINNAGTGYTLTASATGLTGATSTAFNVIAGGAAKLVITVQPANVVAGASISPAVQVTIEDAGGNTVTTATNPVTIAIGTNPGGGTLSGTVTVAAVSGVATFSNLSINKAGTGYTLGASATGLTGATSTAFNVTAGAASKLAFTVLPTNVAAGASITPAVQVTVQDAQGNTVTSATNSITMAIGTNPSGGTLGGTTTVAAVSGVATFSTLNMNKSGNGYTLGASATGLTSATSSAFNVTPGAANKLAFTVQPANVGAGAAITPAVQVTIQDSLGNTVTSAVNAITMAIGTNPGGGTLAGTTTVAAVSGVATFSNLSINNTGTGYTLSASATGLTGATSSAFNVTAGAATKLAITAQPTNVAAGAAITPAVQVSIEDAQGNVITSATSPVTMSIATNPGGGTLSGTTTVNAVNGIATFANLTINKSGTGYTLAANATGLTTATTTLFNVTTGSVAKLAITVQPTNVAAGAPITPAVQVSIEDAQGNVVTSATNSVTMAIGTNPSGGTLSGTTTVAAVSGVATFSNLSINNAGTGYTLAASATGLTGATSSAFNVIAGGAAKLVITVEPTNVAAGAPITPAVQVSIEDSQGNVVTSATNSITMAIGTNPSGGTLAGTASVAAVSGVATFSNLSINNAGVGYTLTASATGLTGATSSAFNVIAGGAAKLAFTVQPTNVTAGTAIAPAVHVTIQDSQGNTVTTATNSVTIAIGTNPASGTLSGTVTVAAVNGIATFSTLSIDKAGTGYTLAASATGLTGATSNAFNVTAGGAAKLAITAQPTNATAGVAIAPAIQVSIEDASGNVVNSAANSVTMAIGTNPGGGTLAGTTTVAALNGVATFSTLSINKIGTGYTLTASATGLAGATSSAFNITAGPAASIVGTAGTTQSALVNSVFAAFSVKVTDAGGNAVQGVLVTWTAPSTGASGTFTGGGVTGTATTDATGSATAPNFTANFTNGAYIVNATVPGVAAPAAFSLTNLASAPVITSVAPTFATAGGPAFVLTVNGTNFVTTSVVQFGVAPVAMPTTFVSSTKLTANIPASAIASAGPSPVSVVTPAPGGGNSGPTPFTINNPVPTITSIAPTSAVAGGAAFNLTVNGTGFFSYTIVNWNGANRPTTFVSGTQLTAAIPATDIVAGGMATVTAFNPPPVGGTSAGQTFTINNPAPVLTSLSPTSASAGSAAFVLTVNGSKFVNGAVVSFNGVAKTSTFVNAGQVTAAITAADIATGGTFNVIVTNPAPTVGPSAALQFNVNNPVPTVTSAKVNGATHASGGVPLNMTIAGTNFVTGSTVNFGTNPAITPTSVTATQILVTIPASDVATAGNVNVTVTNPAPGGGTTAATVFTVDGFTVSGPANTPVKAGQPANIVITVTATNAAGFANPISFAVTGLPAHSTATFSPANIPSFTTSATTTTLTIMTTSRGAAPPSAPVDPPAPPLTRLLPVLWLAAMLAGLAAMRIARRAPQRRRYATVVPLAMLLLTGAVLAGCAGGKAGTPAGPAQLTITATSGTMAVPTAANSVTLTVQ
jgi:hypothetical protein